MAVDTRSEALVLLRRAGAVISGDLDELHVYFSSRRFSTIVSCKFWDGPVASSAISGGNDTPFRTLHVGSRAGADVLAAATAGACDLITFDPERVIIGSREWLPTDLGDRPSTRRSRDAWGRWAVDRVLSLSRTPLTQRAIADATGVTQQAVSAILRRYPEARTPGTGFAVASKDREKIIDGWLTEYPGPGRVAMHWYGLDSLPTQVSEASMLIKELDSSVLVTGDVAADTIAPWRRPTRARLYVREIIDFTPAGFTPADADEATMTVVLADDPTIWTVADAFKHGTEQIALADPLIVLWDLLHTSEGADVTEAAGILREVIISGETRG